MPNPASGVQQRSQEEFMLARRLVTFLGAGAIALSTVACSQSDPGITTAVKGKLAADDTVKSYRIDVDTKDRVVTLNGAVDTPVARTRAVELARGTDGVREVVDQLTVTPGVTPTTGIDDKVQGEARDAARDADAKLDDAQKKAGDKTDQAGDMAGNAALTAAVKTKFLADTDISGLRIDVDSKNGVVTLTGNVPTAAEKTRALKVARETDGVKSVVDRLKVVR
jgi:hyperosmotically inducible periplasmic protein